MCYIEDQHYPIDKNKCENAIHPFVVGQRRWLLSNNVAGARVRANLYSLIETANANRIEPYCYLCELVRRLPHAHRVDD